MISHSHEACYQRIIPWSMYVGIQRHKWNWISWIHINSRRNRPLVGSEYWNCQLKIWKATSKIKHSISRFWKAIAFVCRNAMLMGYSINSITLVNQKSVDTRMPYSREWIGRRSTVPAKLSRILWGGLNCNNRRALGILVSNIIKMKYMLFWRLLLK